MASRSENKRLVTTLLLVVVGMFGFGFALVPLYDVFCEITGINGKTSNVAAVASEQVDNERLVTVEFVTYVRGDMPWQFEPKIERIKVHPGETHQVSFLAKNLSGGDTVGQAIPSVSPGTGALYFSKIECFCFNNQPLPAGEETEMGLVFYVDPALPESIGTLTLSYTLYNITDKVGVAKESQT
ncbi:cytochrome c oxidase assembly protein [Ferrimonas marina]|uniref:Cytochrome c oxidase assembly protein CtaG n=1 Tax=Ferrimonas marina TaxID=299255 RepID=A0A1M5XSR2_9GAMM|nr:cytochrome c oxidase assembly protein [Ferrimonas marina]SHI02847.1 cytochrome c oxidase assembly protein subunit 11 [Ferrimonas marina]